MGVDADAATGQLVDEAFDRRLLLVAGDDHGLHVESPVTQVVDRAHRVGVVGEPEVGAHLLLLDVAGVDADHDVDLVLHALQEFDLGIRIEPRQDARGMEVAEEFAAEFEVKLVVELTGPLEDGLGLFT